MDSSPQSSLLSPPSSPGSSFSSLPSSLFSSLPASPPSRNSPLPLVLPSLSLQHDGPVRDSYIVLGSQPSIKSELLDFLDIQALSVDFYQTDNVYDILTPVCDAILDRFREGLPLMTSSSPPASTSRDFIAQSRSRFFTAAILVLSSSAPTPLERRLISALSHHIPVIPVVSHHRRRRFHNSGHPPPLTPLQLKTILFHSPPAIYKIQQEAAHRFLSWHYSQSIESQKPIPIQTEHVPCYQQYQYSSITLDPFHLPTLVLLSISLCKSLVSAIYVPQRVFTIAVIGAFCTGVGVGCYLTRG